MGPLVCDTRYPITNTTTELGNGTSVTEFILLGFPMTPNHQILLFIGLLIIYVTILAGNMVIISIACVDRRLHTPMYFFLGNLALLDICFTTAIVPKILFNLVTGQKTISFTGCLTQSYFYFLLGTTEFLILAVMSFDRYVAICYPLRYNTIMNSHLCSLLVLGSWAGGFLDTIVQTVLTFQLSFCGPNVINHYFCDVEPLIKLACSDTRLIVFLDFVLASLLVLGSLLLSMVSYICIVAAIVRMPSAKGRWKAFSTCASHMTVVFIVYGSCIFMCARPTQSTSLDSSKIVAVANSILTPLLNPFIYSLRNKVMKDALVQAISRGLPSWKRKTPGFVQ
ncbi:olfactory receptor 6J1 [Ambystoma mexicanum]|uniref:olfactory receptor 6J1 n=1 Tax=Ambystoma mexicanum TaxID=8296 RepID=UPI0037E9C92F